LISLISLTAQLLRVGKQRASMETGVFLVAFDVRADLSVAIGVCQCRAKITFVMLRHPFNFSNSRFRRLTVSDRESLSACGHSTLLRRVPRDIRIVTVACETRVQCCHAVGVAFAVQRLARPGRTISIAVYTALNWRLTIMKY